MQARTISRADPCVPAPPSDAAPGPDRDVDGVCRGHHRALDELPIHADALRNPQAGPARASGVHSRQDIRDWEGDAMRFLRDQGLAITMFGIFAVTMVGLVLTGWNNYNGEQIEHSMPTITLRAVPHDSELRRSRLRELGERVPADGGVCAADRLPVQPRLLRVEGPGLRRGAPGR